MISWCHNSLLQRKFQEGTPHNTVSDTAKGFCFMTIMGDSWRQSAIDIERTHLRSWRSSPIFPDVCDRGSKSMEFPRSRNPRVGDTTGGLVGQRIRPLKREFRRTPAVRLASAGVRCRDRSDSSLEDQ